MFSFAAIIPLGNLTGLGTIGNTSGVVQVQFVSILSSIIGILTGAGALWFIFNLFAGALAWISAGSDKQALDNAKKRITNAIIGLLILVIAYALIGVIGAFLGIDLIGLENLITSIQIH